LTIVGIFFSFLYLQLIEETISAAARVAPADHVVDIDLVAAHHLEVRVVRMLGIVILVILVQRAEHIICPGGGISLSPEPVHIVIVRVRLGVEVLAIKSDAVLIESRVALCRLVVKIQKLPELVRVEIAQIVVPAGRLFRRLSPPRRAGGFSVIDIYLKIRCLIMFHLQSKKAPPWVYWAAPAPENPHL